LKFEGSLGNSSRDSISKTTRAKWTGDMAQVVECCLLCKLKALSSNPPEQKQKKETESRNSEETDTNQGAENFK
jgi:hypothetical protein